MGLIFGRFRGEQLKGFIPSCSQNEYQAARSGTTQAYYTYVEEPPTMPTT